MGAIPAVLIQPLQAALQSQGFPAGTVRSDGTLNPAGILAGAFTEVEYRSSLTPTIRLQTAGMLAEGPPNPFLAWMRPTVVLKDKLGGETVIAPAGVSQGGSVLPALLVVAALFGAGYAFARATQ